jgi:hypothetical protein
VRPRAWLCALLVAATAPTLRAEVALELEQCDSLAEGALREHLALELSTLGLEQATPRLKLRCEGSLVLVELTRDSGEHHPVELRLELRDTARGERARLVALAASELIAQAERVAVAPPSRPEPVTHLPKPVARGPRERVHQLFGALNAGFAGSERTTLWGGAVGARLGFERWALLLDTRFERGEATLALSDVRWSSLSAFVGAQVHTRADFYELSAGLGLRAGWLVLGATATPPYEGQRMTAPWAGLALPLRAALLPGERLRPFVGLEGGYVFLPVRGRASDGRLMLAQRGLWMTASAGLGVSL